MRSSAHPATPVEPADAVVLGETVVDLLADPPGPLEDAGRYARHLGGACANLAVGLARQGVKTALLTLVGGDALGRFLRARLVQEGVAVDGVGVYQGQGQTTARTGVVLIGGGEFLAYRQPSADMLLQDGDFSPAQVTRGRLLHVGSGSLVRDGGRAATMAAVELARQAGMLVSCDVNYRPHQWAEPREGPPTIRKLLRKCDVVKLAHKELLWLCGTDQAELAASQIRQLGPAVVVVTNGAQGCLVECPAGQAYLAADQVRVVDPTGAGDAFMAGLLSVLLRELSVKDGGTAVAQTLGQELRALTLEQVKQACSRGNYLGARACSALGATTAIPRAG